jgi:hypothetical protein
VIPSFRAIAGPAARSIICIALFASSLHVVHAQADLTERTFHQPKSTVEKALKQLQTSMSGHLPTLDGFAQGGEHPLNTYQRAFFQCSTQVRSAPDGGSVVRVSAKITAWHSDANPAHAGYQLLSSNGRIESDILDQLSDQLSSNNTDQLSNNSPAKQESKPGDRTQPATSVTANEPVISAPISGTSATGSNSAGAFSVSSNPASSASDLRPVQPTDAKTSSKGADAQTEAASLEEVLKHQAHPRNLVAVKKSGTPVVGSPSLTGKTLFLASEQDEFEMLDFTADWVHVRISGLSRGWIWRTSLEMPEGIPDVSPSAQTRPTTAADLFQVSREETAPFPGDWVALRGKNVMIISVQKVRENDPQDGPTAKLEFAKSLLDQHYTELAKSHDLSGLVLIFDSSDGGMIAATLSTIQKWKAGTLNDAGMWHQCYFDPPETFTIPNAQTAASSSLAGR